MPFWAWTKCFAQSASDGTSDTSDGGQNARNSHGDTSDGGGKKEPDGATPPFAPKIPGAWEQSDDEDGDETAVVVRSDEDKNNGHLVEDNVSQNEEARTEMRKIEQERQSPNHSSERKAGGDVEHGEVLYDYNTEIREQEQNEQATVHDPHSAQDAKGEQEQASHDTRNDYDDGKSLETLGEKAECIPIHASIGDVRLGHIGGDTPVRAESAQPTVETEAAGSDDQTSSHAADTVVSTGSLGGHQTQALIASDHKETLQSSADQTGCEPEINSAHNSAATDGPQSKESYPCASLYQKCASTKEDGKIEAVVEEHSQTGSTIEPRPDAQQYASANNEGVTSLKPSSPVAHEEEDTFTSESSEQRSANVEHAVCAKPSVPTGPTALQSIESSPSPVAVSIKSEPTEDDGLAATSFQSPVVFDPVGTITLHDGNELVEDGNAIMLRVVDFPQLEPEEENEKGRPSTSANHFTAARLPSKDTYYDSRSIVELLKFAYTKADTSMTKSKLSAYANFSAKRDVLGNAPSKKPAYITVRGRNYFLCYAGKIALWGDKVQTHKHRSDLWTGQNEVRKSNLSPLMLIGNVAVPAKGCGKPFTNLPRELFEEFDIQPAKSKGLKLNINAIGRRHPVSAATQTSGADEDGDEDDDAAESSSPLPKRKSEAAKTPKKKIASTNHDTDGFQTAHTRKGTGTPDYDSAADEMGGQPARKKQRKHS
jgi:hypothetical protein